MIQKRRNKTEQKKIEKEETKKRRRGESLQSRGGKKRKSKKNNSQKRRTMRGTWAKEMQKEEMPRAEWMAEKMKGGDDVDDGAKKRRRW